MKILLIFSLVIPLSALANSMAAYIQGLKADLHFTKIERALEIDKRVRLAPFGPVARVMSPDATATYNSRLNIISLHKDLIEKRAGDWIIKDARIIRGTQFMTVPLTTIFHEMGHAELDTMIENRREIEDHMIMNHYNSQLKDFYKKNFPRFNSFDLFHEHFSYYRSDLIDFMYAEQDRIFLNNGFNKFRGSCYLNPLLREVLKKGISKEDFQKFLPLTKGETPFYRTQIKPRFVHVRGKDADLQSATFNKPVLTRTHDLFWAYHQHFYNFAINEVDYLRRLNQSSAYKKTLATCRAQLWDNNR
jgi:hypothetical protein